MDNKADHSTSHSLATQVIKVYTAVESSSEAVFVTDPKGRIEYANQKFLELNQWTEEQASGRSISEIPYSKKIALKLLQSLKEGQSWNMRHQIETPLFSEDGKAELVWVRTTIDPITEIPEEISGFVGIQRVIDQEVKRELQAKDELSKVLALAIKQERMLEEMKHEHQKALKEAATRSTFLANMSHEIRTPLNGVLGMAELLGNTQLTKKQTHLINIIRQSGESLLCLINDILDLSKIEAGKLELKNESCDLRSIIEEIADTFAERASSKGLELICIYPSNNHSFFICDKQRLTQILTNLVSNAIKFTDEGEVTLEVLINEDDDNAPIRFEVRDTGIGIPKQDLDLIFESFSQSQQTLEQASKGTGLGLTICKHLTKLMGGEMGVTSKLGEGSCFWFTVRLEKDKGKDIELFESEKRLLGGIKVLIIDDNQSNSQNLASQLKQWHIETVIVETAQDALRTLERAQEEGKPFSLAMLDHDMPDISGLNLARLVKQNRTLGKLPLILMNSIHNLEETTVWTTAGIKSYLTKPIKHDDLYHALLTTLSISGNKRSSENGNETKHAKNVQFQANILVVEDNPVNQELAHMVLKELGCSVHCVSNGQEALNLLEEKAIPFDLVLMDCQMPVLDGYEATRKIRERSDKYNQLPVIALTANAMEGDRQRCLDAGMNDYLSKPFSKRQLSETLKKWLPEKPNDQEQGDEIFDDDFTIYTIENDIFELEEELLGEPELSAEETNLDEEPKLAGKADTIILNQTTLNNIRSLQREGAPDILQKIVGLYLENSSKIIDELRQAVEKEDAKKIRSTAHSLKSSSANLGADLLAETCKEMESLGRQDQLQNIKEEFKRLSEQYEATCAALKKEIGQTVS